MVDSIRSFTDRGSTFDALGFGWALHEESDLDPATACLDGSGAERETHFDPYDCGRPSTTVEETISHDRHLTDHVHDRVEIVVERSVRGTA